MLLKLYLDNCCYNRPFDDLKQEKINLEAEAINYIINMYENKKIIIYKSKIIDYEIEKMMYGEKKRQVEDLYDALDLKSIPHTANIDKRVEELEKYNIHFMDAYHIAYAESKNIDYFITVDKQLINASKRANLKLVVLNPIDFIMEVM